MENSVRNIAMLIDGDNAQASKLENIIQEISKYGRITIKRIYGDWTSHTMKGWQNQLNSYAIKPMQKFAWTKGKNSTDIALIIDAMDILHREKVDGFCIVSSDSDFAGLANRIKENALFVMGVGRKQTPESFVNACDVFTFIENIGNNETLETNIPKVDIQFLRKAYSSVEQENGEALLSQVVKSIRTISPGFDTRAYGFKNYSALFKSLDSDFEVIYHKDNSTISIKDKK